MNRLISIITRQPLLVVGVLVVVAGVIAFTGRGGGDDEQDLRFPPADEAFPEDREVLRDVGFPLYAAEGLEMELSGWGGGDGEPVTDVRLSFYASEEKSLDVDSSIEEDGVDVADLLSNGLEGEPKVARGERELLIDGVKRRLAFASAGDRWAATGQAGDVTIQVTARGFTPEAVRLRQLADPQQALSGSPEYRPLRPAYDVLDKRRVTELVHSTPLQPIGAQLAGEARPGIGLLATDQPGASWIGGQPSLPEDARWPSGPDGPMVFIAQLALADLDPRAWTGPRTGHLHIFCDPDPEDGSIEDKDGCRVLHSPAGAELRTRPFPADLREEGRLSQQHVMPTVGLTVPVNRPDTDWEALWQLRERLEAEQGWTGLAGQLLGWPTWQNDDNLPYLAEQGGGKAEDWSVLLQTDALDAELYVALPTADLAAGRFDNVQATVEYD